MVTDNKKNDMSTENGNTAKKADSTKTKNKKNTKSATKELMVPKKDFNELNDKFLRLTAEFANYKKRTEKEKGELGIYVKMDVFSNLLPIIDDFNRLIEHLDQEKEKLVEGVEMISKKLGQFMEQYKVKVIEAEGQPFDPELHEALMMQPVEKEEDDHKVTQVLEKGYTIGEKVIRHSRVAVGKMQ